MADEYLSNWQSAVDDQLAFGKNAYLEAIPDLAYSIEAAQGIGGIQSRTSLDQAALANGLAKRRESFNSMEDQYAANAMAYGSDANKNAAAGRASTDVASQFAAQRAQTERAAARTGVNPSSGKATALAGQMDIEQAKAMAQASNKARQDVEATADAKQKTAIGFGTNLTSQAAQAAQSSAYAGNAALASSSDALKQRLNFAGGVSNIYGNAASGYQNLWGTSNLTAAQKASMDAQAAATQAKETNSAIGAVGSIVGSDSGAGLISGAAKWLTSLF